MKEIEGTVTRIRRETYDVKSFEILLDEELDYICGQYVIVSIKDDEDHKDANKPFTISSAPLCSNFLELTIKEIGDFTGAMHDIEPGARLKINGPLGDSLNFEENIDKDVVFLAAGSGITPFISALKYKIGKRMSNKAILLFGNKKVEDIIFKDELEELNKRDDIKIINTLSREPETSSWGGERGHVDIELIEKHVPDICSKIFFMCGPPGMVEQLEEKLKEKGVPSENIRSEDWRLPAKRDRE